MVEIKHDPTDGDTKSGRRGRSASATTHGDDDVAARVLAEERERLAADEQKHEAEERDRELAAERERQREAERARERERSAAMKARTVRWATTVVSLGSAAFAIALALHIVFYVFDANTENPLVSLVGGLADGLVVFFRELFTPEDPRVQVLVNYGMAAIFWLLVGRAGIALLRRIR